jgi:hypothetical protein
LLLNEPRKYNIIALYALCIPYAPFPALGLFPFVLFFLFKRDYQVIYENKYIGSQINVWVKITKFISLNHWIDSFRKSITFYNMLILGVVVIVWGSYYEMNSGIMSTHGFIFNIIKLDHFFLLYMFFC